MRWQYIKGPMLAIIVAILPILLWWFLAPQPIELSSDGQRYDALGRAAALAGLSLLAWNIILSARLPVLERLYLGLDRAYRAHRIIGGTVLVLILIHVMAITAKYSSLSLASGYDFLISTSDKALIVGKLALTILILLVPLSLYISIKHEWFVRMQRVLGAVIFLGGFHALFVDGSDVRSNSALFAYMVLLGGTAAGLYIYRSIFHRSIKPKLAYEVESVEHVQNVTKIWMKPKDRALAFYAGQFAFFRFVSQRLPDEVHPFSISSGSDDARLRVSAKVIGDYTAQLSKLRPGDEAIVEGPYGQFSFTKYSGKKQVWVAGEIGVTPFVSMAHSLPSGYEIILYYCVDTAGDAVFRDELVEVARKKPGFTLKIVTKRDKRLTGKELAKKRAEHYLLCAPPSMMRALKEELVKYGVQQHTIHYEEFRLK